MDKDCCENDSHQPAKTPSHACACEAEEAGHSHETTQTWKTNIPLLLALFILLAMLVLAYGFRYIPPFPINLVIYLVAYLLSGYQVINIAWDKAKQFDFFNEFFLMTVATTGAFCIGSYSEGVAVMVFYSIGEWFQDLAVRKAKRSIKALLDIRPAQVTVIRHHQHLEVNPNTVALDEIILVKAGEKVALDGILYSDTASFNTAALTGESKPDTKHKGEKVLAGMLNLDKVAQIQVQALFKDSKLSQILEMVQNATARKSKTQLFISRFAKVYTPLVFLLALAVCVGPYFFTETYHFRDWFYRALVFLVISCPCALVVSIPLGYFGGIGLASRNGILFKGANFLDAITQINTVIMDKTGTLTKGVFKVQEVMSVGISKKKLVSLAAALEQYTAHPIAQAIVTYANEALAPADEVEEISGYGLKGLVNHQTVLAGNTKLLKKYNVRYPKMVDKLTDTVVVLAINNQYVGYIRIADELKDDALLAIQKMQRLNLQTIMLSGDKQAVVNKVAATLGIGQAYGDLLPDEKFEKVQEYKLAGSRTVFVGDGINDAPVIALADVGIAMGGLGSDAAIETADIVIQNDQPSKIIRAIEIGRITRNVVWQNIALAMGVKCLVLVLGAGGLANLWEAVIADVGVALLAILNAVRIQRIK